MSGHYNKSELSTFLCSDGTPPSSRTDPANPCHSVRVLHTRPPFTFNHGEYSEYPLLLKLVYAYTDWRRHMQREGERDRELSAMNACPPLPTISNMCYATHLGRQLSSKFLKSSLLPMHEKM